MAKKTQTAEQTTVAESGTSFEMTDDVLNTVIQQQKSAAAACLRIFVKMAEGNTPTGDELTLLFSQGYDNKFAIEREVDKRRVTLELKARAKTRAHRDQLRKRVESATAAFNSEAPGIESEIAEFVRVKQARVDELRQAITVPQIELQDCDQAVELLKSPAQLPQEIETKYRALQSRLHDQFREFRSAESTAESMRGRIAIADRAAQFVGKRNVELPHDVRNLLNSEGFHGHDGTLVDAAKLLEYRSRAERKLRDAELIIARDRDEYVQRMAEVEREREFWID